MDRTVGPRFPSVGFLWPALAAASAGELASAMAREFARLAAGPEAQADNREPAWTTPNRIALELTSVRLRDFSTQPDGIPTLLCAPYALHGATIVDFAPGHSLVEALLRAGRRRLFVTDWRSADATMRFSSIDTYLAELNVVVDHLGGCVDLIGLCQGGWMALVYAARFPGKVRKLVLAGAPIDVASGESELSRLARDMPLALFNTLVGLGEGRVLGHCALQYWEPRTPEREEIGRLLQIPGFSQSPDCARLEARFREWYAWTVDLPGPYYLQVVEWLFKENRLATGQLVALGRRIDLSDVRVPIYLLAGRDDEVVAPGQLFALERLAGGSPQQIRRDVAATSHLGLFMGRTILSDSWSRIASWLAVPLPGRRGQDSSERSRRRAVESTARSEHRRTA
jgi:poly(3-hydroxyalkanoate) synthetase